jgi:hypothetical protein
MFHVDIDNRILKTSSCARSGIGTAGTTFAIGNNRTSTAKNEDLLITEDKVSEVSSNSFNAGGQITNLDAMNHPGI